MHTITSVNDQPQLAPLNQLGQGLTLARLNPLINQAGQPASEEISEPDALSPRDEQRISFNPSAMQEAHTLSEDRVARLLGLI